MRYSKFYYKGNLINSDTKIESILMENELEWIIDSEIENASIEILNKTLIWNSGTFYSGYWKYGIFKSGDFYGKWINGIFENGNFKGEKMNKRHEKKEK